MAFAASDDALTTVENVKAWLGKQAQTDPKLTDKLQLYINGYSRAIRNYTGRQFKPTESDKSKAFPYDGMGFLSMAPFEASSITSVTLHTDLPQSSWLVLAAQSASTESLYRVEPRYGTPEGTFLWLRLPELGMYSPYPVPPTPVVRRSRGYEVTVRGNWGAGTVPGDVEIACLIAVSNAVRNPEQFASRSLGEFSAVAEIPLPGEDDTGLALPRGARSLLAPYRRRAFG